MTHGTCSPLLDGLIEAVCLVDPKTLRISMANQVLAAWVGLPRDEFVGKPVVELTRSPEDLFFWEDVAASLGVSCFWRTISATKLWSLVTCLKTPSCIK